MRLAIISDLHLLHWHHRKIDLHEPNPEVLVAISVEQEKPDIIIDAGDTELPDVLRAAIPAHIPILSTQGNHDYYGEPWTPEYEKEFKVITIDGVTFALTPLWTDLRDNNPMIGLAVTEYLADCRQIKGFTTNHWYSAHIHQRTLLANALNGGGIDVVVTHHAPSHNSVHPRYGKGGATQLMVNCGFASHLDEMVEDSGAKLFIHGHTHDEFDYMIGKTRVVCRPCGYPRERKLRGYGSYEPLYIEI